ncbi:MAG TPA: R3H domain-containing nucleic acid-binding protein [Patescibacteria group bacterium]|jgi:spoIIIJ-associated protein|nr:R3H domain-containing nucleic acid-binding protein [Patescibacteria group bacterium]
MADHQIIEYIQNTIREVLQRAGVDAQIEYEDSLADGLVFNIRSRDAKMLIGHQGATLYSLEHIIHTMVARHFSAQRVAGEGADENAEPAQDNRVFFSVDVDDYKKKRQYHIKQMIKEEVAEMKRSGNTVSLPAMPKYERKFVHMYIQEQFPHVNTESLGVEPSRYIKMSL